ncbi:MAG TPA: sulfatase [Candidatus Barnesiella excrementigallinarum]|nr:sulfatase [Candidatus Barnesiella excrementigallinarum]
MILGAQNVQPQSKPNVIFVMIDDYGWADMGYNGSKFYETPNLDRLASESMQFTDGYAAASISSPTRVSLMTGKYPARTGITDWIPGYQYNLPKDKLSQYKMIVPEIPLNMPLEEVTIAEAMKENGYTTYHIGKWHCAEDSLYYPQYQGFDVNIGGWLKGSPNGIQRKQGGDGAYFTPYRNPYLPDGPKGEYLTDRLATEAIKLIENTDRNQPFFMYFSFYAVHTPIEAKPEYVEYFREKAQRMGIDTIQPFTTDLDWYKKADHKAWHWKERVIQSDAEYAALIYSMDENLGRLLQALKDNGIEENTIVCLLSDNGGLSTAEGSPTCNAPLRGGKGWLYEGGIREPYLIKYPKMNIAGKKCSIPVTSVDFYPTILDMAGLPLKPEQHIDGVSLLPILKGDKKFKRGPIYFHYPHYGGKGDTPAGAVRDGDYKLIEFYEDGHVELYNLKNDISEKNDLSKKKPQLASRLLKELQDWRKACGAKMPVHNPDYKK